MLVSAFEPDFGTEKRFSAACAPVDTTTASSRVLTMLMFFILCSFLIVLSLSHVFAGGTAIRVFI
jgi:hypothetical protein